jgi:hypothetical protein
LGIPLGLGIRWTLDKYTRMSAEAGYRILFNDYLDDVSDERPNVLTSPSIYFIRTGEPFAANTLVNRIPLSTTTTAPIYSTGPDQYFTTQIRLIYHIKNKIDCPPLPN